MPPRLPHKLGWRPLGAPKPALQPAVMKATYNQKGWICPRVTPTGRTPTHPNSS